MASDERLNGPTPAPGRRRRSHLRRVLRALQWALNVCVLVIVLLTWTPLGYWLGDRYIDVDPIDRADAIVVLGGMPERAVEAARLHRQGWAPRVIISSTPGNAELLARAARSYGVPEEAILLDCTAVRTADHPRGVQQLPGVDKTGQRFVIVTSMYHTARARAVFRKAGYRHVIVRSPGWHHGGDFTLPRSSWPRISVSDLPKIFHEMVGCWYYRLRGWM
jgi:uncharacterized SAM-binding protein YcdF (DUF218 family)